MSGRVRQPALFEEPEFPLLTPAGQQGDITYVDRRVQNVLNPPESTGMPYWSLNPYLGCAFGCAYCYARYAHRYATERLTESGDADRAVDSGAMPPWLAFERRIYVKGNAPDLVRTGLARAAEARGARRARLLAGESLVIGTATDPYQPAERRFRITRGVLEVLATYRGLHIVVITKSALVTRDVDLLKRIADRSRLTVHLSLITLDRELARRIEPRAPTPDARLRAIGRLRAGGIDVGINIMPVLPGLTDHPAALAALVEGVAKRGATHINAGALRLQAEARQRYLPFIEAEFPDLAPRYRRAYARDSDVGARYRSGLARVVRGLCEQHGVRFGGYGAERRSRPASPSEEQLQLTLQAAGAAHLRK